MQFDVSYNGGGTGNAASCLVSVNGPDRLRGSASTLVGANNIVNSLPGIVDIKLSGQSIEGNVYTVQASNITITCHDVNLTQPN